jgi:uncharacterized Zn finger protein
MEDMKCPGCGAELEILRSGTRKMGTLGTEGGVLPEHGIPTTAECLSCGRRWERDYGDQGPWRPG